MRNRLVRGESEARDALQYDNVAVLANGIMKRAQIVPLIVPKGDESLAPAYEASNFVLFRHNGPRSNSSIQVGQFRCCACTCAVSSAVQWAGVDSRPRPDYSVHS